MATDDLLLDDLLLEELLKELLDDLLLEELLNELLEDLLLEELLDGLLDELLYELLLDGLLLEELLDDPVLKQAALVPHSQIISSIAISKLDVGNGSRLAILNRVVMACRAIN